jgi:hypothetical protein
MKSSSCILIALILALMPISVQAQGQTHSLIFTKISDSVITERLDGKPNGSITFFGKNHWEWFSAIYGDYLVGYGGTSYYARPAGEPGVNSLSIAFLDNNFRIFIDCGVLGLDSEPKAPNGGPGWDVAVFKGDTAVLGRTTIYFLEVPEPGTFALLGLGLAVAWAGTGVGMTKRLRARNR